MEKLNIKKHVPEGNPFIVPDGYFEQLKKDILAQTTLRDESAGAASAGTVHRLLRPIIGIAATLCFAVFGWAVYSHNIGSGAFGGQSGADATEMLFASDDAADYIMLDNDDIYRYLADLDWE